VVIVITLVQILGTILLPFRFKLRTILEVSYRLLRVIAVLALPALLYEGREASARRTPKMALLFDTLLVLPMYLLWSLIWLFSSAPI
jgi:hypothetical protein